MDSKIIHLLLGVVILAAILPENDAAGPPEPTNRMIKGAGEGKKCLVYMWKGVCAPMKCKVHIKAKLTEGGSGKVENVTVDAPFGKDKEGVCLYNEGENTDCCNKIFNGTKDTAKKVEFGDYKKIGIDITRIASDNTTNTWNDQIKVLPWWKGCIPNNPCKNGGTCAPGNSYKCNCTEGYKGQNCTEVDTTKPPITGVSGLVPSFVTSLTLVVLAFLHM